MAHIEIATFKSGKLRYANISDNVGRCEKNESSDVMLIQALFKLAGFNELYATLHFGLSFKDLPEPTGNFDSATDNAIWGFHRRNQMRLLKIDGKVHPANYNNRIMKDVEARLMTITLLNRLAFFGAIIKFNATGQIEALRQIVPNLILPFRSFTTKVP